MADSKCFCLAIGIQTVRIQRKAIFNKHHKHTKRVTKIKNKEKKVTP